MTIAELKKLIDSNSISKIELFAPIQSPEKSSKNQTYEVWAHDHENQNIVKQFGECLINSSEETIHRTYTSLDRAVLALRKFGYSGKIELSS